MSLFDHYVAIDWSAANRPVTGADSIWIAHARRNGPEPIDTHNPSTRAEAMTIVARIIAETLIRRERMLLGFDFPFGYPYGAALLLAGAMRWSALWRKLDTLVIDADDNRSNRFTAAAALNRCLPPDAMRFWGHPHQHRYIGLSPKKPRDTAGALAEKRIVEMRQRGAKPVWQLTGAGCVGSQALLGIARLEALRNHSRLGTHIAVWPFETGFADVLNKPVILAEIYPSRHAVPKDAGIRDEAQVRTVVCDFARADQEGTLRDMLAGPSDLSTSERAIVLSEEGWIVGA